MTARHAALLGALAAIWGASYLLIKYALEGFSAGEVVFLRTALAATVLVLVIRIQGGCNGRPCGVPRGAGRGSVCCSESPPLRRRSC